MTHRELFGVSRARATRRVTERGEEENLPERYQESWRTRFDELVAHALAPDMAVLDVGCGNRPAVPVVARPSGVRYVGIDLSADEFSSAAPGSFDETYVVDVSREIPREIGPFDVAVSWQVLEHVRSLATATENIRRALRPGGKLVALLSGRYAAFSLLNRLLPTGVGVNVMKYLLQRPPDTVFRAFYDDCFSSALLRSFRLWSEANIEPLYRGAGYFAFAPHVQQAYLRYENWALSAGHANLATHYLVEAAR